VHNAILCSNLKKKILRFQIFVDIAEEGVNHDKTYVLCADWMFFYFVLKFDHL
jgi:hypothetical protein